MLYFLFNPLDKWPPYASHLDFEFAELKNISTLTDSESAASAPSTEGLFVRAVYNHKVAFIMQSHLHDLQASSSSLSPPSPREQTLQSLQREGWYPYGLFKKRLESLSITDEEYKSICANPSLLETSSNTAQLIDQQQKLVDLEKVKREYDEEVKATSFGSAKSKEL